MHATVTNPNIQYIPIIVCIFMWDALRECRCIGKTSCALTWPNLAISKCLGDIGLGQQYHWSLYKILSKTFSNLRICYLKSFVIFYCWGWFGQNFDIVNLAQIMYLMYYASILGVVSLRDKIHCTIDFQNFSWDFQTIEIFYLVATLRNDFAGFINVLTQEKSQYFKSDNISA